MIKTTDHFISYNTGYFSPRFIKPDFKIGKLIELDNLIASQEYLHETILFQKIKGSNLTIPYLVEYRGKVMILDGHHTLAAKKINAL